MGLLAEFTYIRGARQRVPHDDCLTKPDQATTLFFDRS